MNASTHQLHGLQMLRFQSVDLLFQAEDGIRDLTVTGVQTCALPISPDSAARSFAFHASLKRARFFDRIRRPSASSFVRTSASISSPTDTSSAGLTERRIEIGRASCRERV